MDDKNKTNEEANRLSAAILRLPHRRRPGFINQQVNSNSRTPAKGKFTRAAYDNNVRDYARNGHMVDGHVLNDKRCNELVAKGIQFRREPRTLTSNPAKGSVATNRNQPVAAAASSGTDQTTACLNLITALLKSAEYEGTDNTTASVNNGSDYSLLPLLDSATTDHISRTTVGFSNLKTKKHQPKTGRRSPYTSYIHRK